MQRRAERFASWAELGRCCSPTGSVVADQMMALSLDSAIDVYLDHIKVERGLTRNTVEAYARDLADFRKFCEREALEQAGEVEPRHLLGWLVSLAERKLSVRSQARMLVTLRNLFRHL